MFFSPAVLTLISLFPFDVLAYAAKNNQYLCNLMEGYFVDVDLVFSVLRIWLWTSINGGEYLVQRDNCLVKAIGKFLLWSIRPSLRAEKRATSILHSVADKLVFLRRAIASLREMPLDHPTSCHL